MITLIFAKMISGALKEIHRISYTDKSGNIKSVVERIHTPGNPIPEDIKFIKPNSQPIIMNQECEAYCHHFNIQL